MAERTSTETPTLGDTFNPYKSLQLNYPMNKVPVSELSGPAS